MRRPSGDEWKTRKGSRVWVETDRRGEWIMCEGCPRPIRVTGVGPVIFAAREHAQRCRN